MLLRWMRPCCRRSVAANLNLIFVLVVRRLFSENCVCIDCRRLLFCSGSSTYLLCVRLVLCSAGSRVRPSSSAVSCASASVLRWSRTCQYNCSRGFGGWRLHPSILHIFHSSQPAAAIDTTRQRRCKARIDESKGKKKCHPWSGNSQARGRVIWPWSFLRSTQCYNNVVESGAKTCSQVSLLYQSTNQGTDCEHDL